MHWSSGFFSTVSSTGTQPQSRSQFDDDSTKWPGSGKLRDSSMVSFIPVLDELK